MNPEETDPPKIGDIMYTFLDPDDKWGLEIVDDPVIVVVLRAKDPSYVYGTIDCLTINGIIQTTQYLDLHHTKKDAYRWYEKYYGKTNLKTFRGQ